MERPWSLLQDNGLIWKDHGVCFRTLGSYGKTMVFASGYWVHMERPWCLLQDTGFIWKDHGVCLRIFEDYKLGKNQKIRFVMLFSNNTIFGIYDRIIFQLLTLVLGLKLLRVS